ncbi:MAG: hypothetical protein II894_08860 [Bacteroidales bacterium]|nr:hypothetical protein [Bacteroidales bacterium]
MANIIASEVFANYIVEKLRRSNPHIGLAADESQYVKAGAVVHIPQAGNPPAVEKNRSTYPAVATRRGDTSVTYALDSFTTEPVHVAWSEQAEISYDKTDSVLGDLVATLMETVGDNILYDWVAGLKNKGAAADTIPAANIIVTAGTLDSFEIAQGVSVQRNSFSYKDLESAQYLMNHQNVPKQGRYALLESKMYQQLLDSLSANQMAAFQAAADLKNGICGRLFGFDILERSNVLTFTGTNTPVVPGTEITNAMNPAALCWQKDCVSIAKGDIMPYQDLGNPLYFGDIFSAEVKMGGRARRSGYEGVVAIIATKKS